MKFLFNIKNFSLLPEWDEYEIFHDEHKEKKTVHGFLLVPNRIKPVLLNEINKIRTIHKCSSKLHYSELSGTKESPKIKAVRDIIILMTDALRTKRYCRAIWGKIPPRCKFILFKKKDYRKLSDSFYNQDGIIERKEIDMRKIETLLRIGLKGGLHYLFNEDNKIRITGFYTDGIGWRRALDRKRVLNRLFYEKEDFIDFSPVLDIEPIVSDHKHEKCLDADRAQLLQVCDCMLGALLNCIYGGRRESYKTKLAKPIKTIINKQKRGSGFRHSGHYKSYILTKGDLRGNNWIFEQLDAIDDFPNNRQYKFWN